MPEAIEGAHMGHPDFRVGGRIFATLSYPRRGFGMVKLTAEQQELFVNTRPKAFAPVPGKWGERGATRSEEHTSELQSRLHLVCRLLLEKKNTSDVPTCIAPRQRPSTAL